MYFFEIKSIKYDQKFSIYKITEHVTIIYYNKHNFFKRTVKIHVEYVLTKIPHFLHLNI